ncbi:MAG TPA: cytochrome c peroxidase, partial [Polyangiales bacterium]|nr:cytochrome c peroxidase [Polyangiales bacterium]
MPRFLLFILTFASLSACVADPDALAASGFALSGRAAAGKRLFEEPLPDTNGRACATCHVVAEDTTLKPESIERRLRTTPDDPLFHRLDADDPAADTLRFEHLKKGLVRVVLPLADNVDLIEFDGAVITPADRTIAVWRGVPSVANTAFTAPYQSDARERTLETQAQSAIRSHSQGHELPRAQLRQIAEFERGTFSSPRAWFVARLLEFGVPELELPVPEQFMALRESEQRGRKVYDAACEACHGGATTDRITKREVVDALFPALTPEGNVRYTVLPGKPPEPVRVARPGVNFMNVGFGAGTYFGQLGVAEAYNASVELPRHRLRF